MLICKVRGGAHMSSGGEVLICKVGGGAHM